MAFLVEDGTGLATSNSYLSVAGFKTYHSDRQIDFSAFSDATIQSALISASDYIDRRYIYVGYRANGRAQAMEWPRQGAADVEDNVVDSTSIPTEIADACAELAITATTAALIPNLDFDSSGGFITEQTDTVGTVRHSVKYSTTRGRKSFPSYGSPDALLRRFARVNRQLVRAS